MSAENVEKRLPAIFKFWNRNNVDFDVLTPVVSVSHTDSAVSHTDSALSHTDLAVSHTDSALSHTDSKSHILTLLSVVCHISFGTEITCLR